MKFFVFIKNDFIIMGNRYSVFGIIVIFCLYFIYDKING